jgi:hypothetical protein
MFRIAILAVLLSFSGFMNARTQPLAKQSDKGAYSIPFASESNRIELEVVNASDQALGDVSVELNNSPTWLSFDATYAPIGSLESGETQVATFVFDQDEKAPVGEVASIEFDIVSSRPRVVGGGILQPDESGVRDDEYRLVETRTIRVAPEAPKELTLRGNYPNPFNPSTKIAYALPQDGNVEIEAFNAIGQRVARIVDDIQQAGYQEALWNAATFPSGVYFYSVTIRTEQTRSVKFGKMLLVK